MVKNIRLLDKSFKLFLPYKEITKSVEKIADRMNEELKYEDVLFLGILNGSFMFTAELFKYLTFNPLLSFLKITSYSGTKSSSSVKELIGFNEDIKGKTVVVLEDIVDTGNTISYLINYLRGLQPKEVKVATCFFKPDVYGLHHKIHYVGIEIPDKFVVGFGLDYNGYGRNYKDLYTLDEPES
jgi:hypoxanthine phosphoribosyltransferase